MVRVNVSLIGDEGETREVRLGREFKIGRGYEFRDVPPGNYRLVAEAGGTPMWDLKVEVPAEKDTTLDLTESNAAVAKDFSPAQPTDCASAACRAGRRRRTAPRRVSPRRVDPRAGTPPCSPSRRVMTLASSPADERGVALPLALMTPGAAHPADARLRLAVSTPSRSSPPISSAPARRARWPRADRVRAVGPSRSAGPRRACRRRCRVRGAGAVRRPDVRGARPHRRLHGRGRARRERRSPGRRRHRGRLGATDIPPTRGPKAHRRVTADVVAIPHLGARAPCALCVRGALTSPATSRSTATNRDRRLRRGRQARRLLARRHDRGRSGRAVRRRRRRRPAASRPPPSTPSRSRPPRSTRCETPGAAQRHLLWARLPDAAARVSDGRATWSGRVVFDAANPLPDGVVFVDTIDGRDGDRTRRRPHAGRRPPRRRGVGARGRGLSRLARRQRLARDRRGHGDARAGLRHGQPHLPGGGAGSLEGLAVALNVQETRGRREWRRPAAGACGAVRLRADRRRRSGAARLHAGRAAPTGRPPTEAKR